MLMCFRPDELAAGAATELHELKQSHPTGDSQRMLVEERARRPAFVTRSKRDIEAARVEMITKAFPLDAVKRALLESGVFSAP